MVLFRILQSQNVWGELSSVIMAISRVASIEEMREVFLKSHIRNRSSGYSIVPLVSEGFSGWYLLNLNFDIVIPGKCLHQPEDFLKDIPNQRKADIIPRLYERGSAQFIGRERNKTAYMDDWKGPKEVEKQESAPDKQGNVIWGLFGEEKKKKLWWGSYLQEELKVIQ